MKWHTSVKATVGCPSAVDTDGRNRCPVRARRPEPLREGCAALSYADLIRHPGNDALHLALEISVLGVARGHPMHVHAEGLRGTGKTTIIRAAAELLPGIRRITGCVYNCDPARPHCPLHRGLARAEVVRLGVETVPAPFLEISPSAKIGTVVGSIDLGRLTDHAAPEAALLPGTLARGHRGVVFIDEINRLADTGPELADALLDVMGTKPGRLQIEETGLPAVVIPCRVTVWAASNPDEEPGPLADIRRQLADRFDMALGMRRPAEPAAVIAVLDRDEFVEMPGHRRRLAPVPPSEPVPGGTPPSPVVDGPDEAPDWTRPPVAPVPEATGRLRQELLARGTEPVPPLPVELRELLAAIYCDFQVESLRAVQAWQAAARLLALRAGKAATDFADLQRTAPLALRHRLEPEELARLLDHLARGRDPSAESAALAGAAPLAAAPGGVCSPEEPAAPGGSGGEVPAATSADSGHVRRSWWQRWRRNPPPGTASAAAAPLRLCDPTELPVITPRQPAHFLTELPPEALILPSIPARGGRQ